MENRYEVSLVVDTDEMGNRLYYFSPTWQKRKQRLLLTNEITNLTPAKIARDAKQTPDAGTNIRTPFSLFAPFLLGLGRFALGALSSVVQF